MRIAVVECELRCRLDVLESLLEEIDGAYSDAQWHRHLDRMNGAEISRLETVRSALLSAPETRALLQRAGSSLEDPLLARRIALLHRRARWAGIESQPEVFRLRGHVDQAIVDFRPQIDGATVSRVERSEVLRRDPDRTRRREAWLATGPLAVHIEPYVRRLLRRRETLARRHGHDGFVSWALDTKGLDQRWLEELLDDLYVRTDAAYLAWLDEAAQRLSLRSGLRPWDLAFAADQELLWCEAAFAEESPLVTVRRVADGLGLGEAAAGVKVALADIPYAALCFAVRPPEDVRILISRKDGRAHHDVHFHEFGHALHWRCLGPISPALRWESSAFNEAMACLWERLAFEPELLLEAHLCDAEQVARYHQGWTRRALYRLRLRMAQVAFEFRAYQANDEDLMALYRDVYSAYLGVPYDEAPGWADNPFWTSHPIYMQNYIIGEAVASQSIAELRRRFDTLIDEPKAGSWLAGWYYEPGGSSSWPEKVRNATGKALGATDLVADLGC